MPKNDLDLVFGMHKGGNPLNQNSSRLGDFVQAFALQLSIFNYVVLVCSI